jgi:CrcB protein
MSPFSTNVTAFLFIGLLGGYTTFSSFSLENLQLLREGEIATALGYALASCAGGILAAYAGLRWSAYLHG